MSERNVISVSEQILNDIDEIVEEALENIEANDAADPTPLIISTDTVPNDVTPTGFISIRDQTDTISIDTNSALRVF